MNRVTIRWTGPRWLKRYDPQGKMKLFWRAHEVYLGREEINETVIASLKKLRYLAKVRVGGNAKVDLEAIDSLAQRFDVTVEDNAGNPR